MNCKSHILIFLSCLYGIVAFSQNIEFIENKGQWDDRVRFMGKLANGAFYVHNDGFTVLQNDAKGLEQLHEMLHDHMLNGKPAKGQAMTLRSHAYRVDFVGASSKSQIIPDKPLFTYNNYFTGDDPAKWAVNCKIYQGITIQNIYPNIDARYYSDNGTFKYDLIVRPGGNVADIGLRYNGVDQLKIKNKELIIGTSVGELKELSPYTYQYNEKGKTEIAAKFVLKDKVVRFDLKNYDPKTTLIIDPTLVFCSFTGSQADNWGFTATYGPDKSMFGGGITMGQAFPVSPGAFQTIFGGGSSSGCFTGIIDIGIMKLTPDGTNRVYATFIGGSQQDMPQSLIVDDQGNLIVAGRTNSPVTGPGAYPVTSPMIAPAGISNNRSDYDIVITKLNAAGNGLIGSRRIGGNNEDGANITPCGGNDAISLLRNYGDEARGEVIVDAAGNIYMASCTQSVDFPVLGAIQSTKGDSGTGQDGVVLKFNSNLSSLLFATYLGGSGNDAAYVLALSPLGEIYVAGGTESSKLPGSTVGTIGPSNHGGIDGFISVLSNNGSSILRTSFIGTPGIDQIYGIQFDRFGFPYAMGQTTGSWPIFHAPWFQANGKQFIIKLEKDLSNYVYSTAFGKGEAAPDISPVAFLVDRCENVYISGWGGEAVPGQNFPTAGVQGLPVTGDALKSAPDIDPTNQKGEDFYFFVLKRDATAQLYGSFFGQNNAVTIGDHVDGGTSRFDRDGVIYQAICASCNNNSPFPTTQGAWARTKPQGVTCNLALVKIAFNLSGVRSGVKSIIKGRRGDTSGCVPLTVDFIDTVQNAVRYEWTFGDGSPMVSTTAPATTHTFNTVGTFRVMLVAIDSNTCNIRDTSYVNIRATDLRAVLDFTPVKLNPCDSFKYRFDNTSVAPAARPFGPQTFSWDFGDNTPKVTAGPGSVFHTYTSPGTYTVRLFLLDNAYCNFPDTVTKQVRVAALVDADFETPPEGCAPYNAQFNNTSQAGSQFQWDFGDGSTSTGLSPSHLYSNPGTYTITLIAIDSATCNKIDTTSKTIQVLGPPTADFSAAPQPPITNTPISFTNLSSADAINFKWFFGDGDTLATTSRNIVQHEYNKTGNYNACLVARNRAGCPDSVCRQISTLIEPAVDVPNAFTPLKGGANSVVYVRGYGIAKMKFTIYARWGEKVFESQTKSAGWDGRYKGQVLPMDVYAYTLEVEFTDGTRTTKKGDITLIR